MKPLDWPLLADENIQPDVVAYLRSRGMDVRSVLEFGVGLSDREILRRAHSDGRVVLTHDSDFGALVFADGDPFIGIVYLRPGHISASFVLEMISAIEVVEMDASPPFVLVAERRRDQVRLRLRMGAGGERDA